MPTDPLDEILDTEEVPKTFKVKNVVEAVKLASRFRGEAKYDLFRGQNENWQLQASGARVAEDCRAEEESRLQRFADWVHNTPGLEQIDASEDAIYAVAQHYGMKTAYIDFTTEPSVAGFFASDYQGQKQGFESCILCLSAQDLDLVWKSQPKELPRTRLVRIYVADLWRLEAQFGVFLYCPWTNLESSVYPLDRILFPFNGPVDHPTADMMYPKRKSHLEILLDQYFMRERMLRGRELLKKFGATRIEISPPPDEGCNPHYVISGGIPHHSSWDQERLRPYLRPTAESIHVSLTDVQRMLPLDPELEPTKIGSAVTESVKEFLTADGDARRKLINWGTVYGSNDPHDIFFGDCLPAVTAVWDGLRGLPYADADVARAIGNCVALQAASLRIGRRSMQEAASLCFGKTIEVEFTTVDGSYSRGYVSEARLRLAVREDISSYLKSEDREQVLASLQWTLAAVFAPQKLFQFNLLATLFAREIVPTQALWRSDDAVIYSAARLRTFGLV